MTLLVARRARHRRGAPRLPPRGGRRRGDRHRPRVERRDRGGARPYERDGRVRVLREPDGPFRQREWVTRMARLAATEHGADWVINGDVDEFWWPRGGSLPEVLAADPAALRDRPVLRTPLRPRRRRRPAVPGADDAAARARRPRSTTRASPWRPFRKVVHRASSGRRARRGRATPSARHELQPAARLVPDRGASTSRSARRPRSSGRAALWGERRGEVLRVRGGRRRAPGTAYHALAVHGTARRGGAPRRTTTRSRRNAGRASSVRCRRPGSSRTRGVRDALRALAVGRGRARVPAADDARDRRVRGRRGRARRGRRRPHAALARRPRAARRPRSSATRAVRLERASARRLRRARRSADAHRHDAARPRRGGHRRDVAPLPPRARRSTIVIVTDHRSVDGTSEILREHARDGRVVVLREEARRAAAGRVGDAHGAPGGDRARRRLGDQRATRTSSGGRATASFASVLAAVPRALRGRPRPMAALRPPAGRASRSPSG